MKPSLDSLMLFHEVIAAGSMTRASENLGLAKSTISRQIAKLEAELGTLLLKRNTRKLVPTDIGRDVFERCQRIAQDVHALNTATEQSRAGVHGTLRVSMPSEFGSAWLGKAISDYAWQYPDVKLIIDVHTHMVDLIDTSYDITIQFGTLRASRLTYRRLATLSRSLYASARYLDSRGHPHRLEDLNDHQFVITDLQQRERTWSIRDGQRRRIITPNPRIVVNSMRLAREMVIGGSGLALLPDAMAASYVESGVLVKLFPQWKWPTVQATATVLAREGIPRKVRLFLDFIAERLSGGDTARMG